MTTKSSECREQHCNRIEEWASTCFFRATYAVMRCHPTPLSVCLSGMMHTKKLKICLFVLTEYTSILSKGINISSNFFTVEQPYHSSFFRTKRHGNIPIGIPRTGAGVGCRWSRQQSRFWANIWLHLVLSTLRL